MSAVVFDDVLYANSKFRNMGHDDFWGQLDEFSNGQVDTILINPQTHIFEYQKAQLINASQDIAFEGRKNDQDFINKLLQESSSIATINDSENQIMLTQVMHDILASINSTWGIIRDKESKTNSKAIEQNFINIVNKLKEIDAALGANNVIDGKYISELKRLCENDKIVDLTTLIKHQKQLQGEILEELGKLALERHIPEIKGISTNNKTNLVPIVLGNVYGANSKQLITDLAVIDLNKDIKFRIRINKQEREVTLEEFIQIIQNQTNETIQIVDEVAFLGNTLVNIQAKSGLKQLPYNISSSTISLEQCNLNDGPALRYSNFLKRIHQLRKGMFANKNNNKIDASKEVKKDASTYKLMGDYILGGGISKVLHLSQTQNQYVLTPNGFQTFAQRMLELFNGRQSGGDYLFRFSPRVSLTDGFYNQKRKVIINFRNKI